MTLRLRPRNPWEALDLGLALARNHGVRMYVAWFAVYLPFMALAFTLFWETPIWAWVMLWWLKPLFDRVVLEVLSAELFGDEIRIASLLARLPVIAWRSGIIGALTWRRFDLARSLHLPVYQLERLSWGAARQRIRILDREARGAAVWLTFLLANVEAIFGIAISIGIALLAPVQTPIDILWETWTTGTFGSDTSLLRGALINTIAMSMIEPLYVTCGFTLYLQRRTALEGWDIELRFRQLATRLEAPPRAAPAVVPAIALMLACAATLAALPATVARAEEPPQSSTVTQASTVIKDVLKDREFGHEEQVRRLKYVGPEWKSSNDSGHHWDWSWLESALRFGARAARFAAWVVGGLAVCYVLYHLARYVRMRGWGGVPRSRPDFLFGLDVRPESLPDDVPGAAEALARAGRVREALSLLYRASLVRFMDAGLEFTQGDTEGDCLRRVERSTVPARFTFFKRLVNAWQVLAYGHRPVPVDAAVQFAREWRAQFPPGDAAPGDAGTPQPA